MNFSNIDTNILQNQVLANKQISLSMLRLDKVHAIVCGNKLFKLHYFLEHAINNKIRQVVTFGGAYSNHLVAAAYACKHNNIQCTGIVRGEKPHELSHTLKDCIQYGMQLKFISRDEYDLKETSNFLTSIKNEFNDCLIIPEGGYHPTGAKGAALINKNIAPETSHIICASGTATTIAGLLLGKQKNQQVVAISVLKGISDTEERLQYLTGKKFDHRHFHFEGEYHFGGYAKKNEKIIYFMNSFYEQFQIPTDFVYTAKMMYATFDLINKDFFPKGSNILCVHTGGLQGNQSLPVGALTF